MRGLDKAFNVQNHLILPRRYSEQALAAPKQLLTPYSPNFPISKLLQGAAQPASGAWASANAAIALRFYLPVNATVYQLGWMNGSGTMTDAVDIGIYAAGGATKYVAAGATTRSGVSSLQFVDVADTALGPGWYWLAMSSNGTTAANNQGITTGALQCALLSGVLDKATSHPLPAATWSPAGATIFTIVPLMCIALRTLV